MASADCARGRVEGGAGFDRVTLPRGLQPFEIRDNDRIYQDRACGFQFSDTLLEGGIVQALRAHNRAAHRQWTEKEIGRRTRLRLPLVPRSSTRSRNEPYPAVLERQNKSSRLKR